MGPVRVSSLPNSRVMTLRPPWAGGSPIGRHCITATKITVAPAIPAPAPHTQSVWASCKARAGGSAGASAQPQVATPTSGESYPFGATALLLSWRGTPISISVLAAQAPSRWPSASTRTRPASLCLCPPPHRSRRPLRPLHRTRFAIRGWDGDALGHPWRRVPQRRWQLAPSERLRECAGPLEWGALFGHGLRSL